MDLVENVVVSNLLNDREVQITWDALTDAVSYKVYRKAVPYGTFTLITTVTAPTVTYTDTPSIIPINIWYYKVAGVDILGNESPLPTYGVTYVNNAAFTDDPFTQSNYPANSNMKYIFEEIRRRDLWMLENDGEPMKLLKRRWEGTRCPLIDPEDGSEQCRLPEGSPKGTVANACYGTGYVGGYYTPVYEFIVRRWRTGDMVKINNVGFRLDMKPRMWTIWVPLISTGDIIIDQMNRRWEVTNENHTSMRGLILHQEFEVELKMPRDIIYKIPV